MFHSSRITSLYRCGWVGGRLECLINADEKVVSKRKVKKSDRPPNRR